MTRRTDRVGDLLRTEISEILLREMSAPRIRLSTVSDVDVSPDLRHALVRVSVLGEESHRNESIDALRKAGGFIRMRLAKKLKHLRVIPDFSFELDRGPEHSQRITDLLEEQDDHDTTA